MEIQKGVPVPTTGRTTQFPWQEMESGDSVVVPIGEREYDAAQRYVSTNARMWLQRRPDRAGWRVVTRKEDDQNIRVWLIAPAAQ